MFADWLRRLTAPRFQTRYLQQTDIPALLALEHAKWEPNQAATESMLRQRIAAYPTLCIGSFCLQSGKALASTFMRPVNPAIFTAPTRWDVTANLPAACELHSDTRALFGISLSSTNAAAADDLYRFFYPRALKAGWRDVYLGSPMPGFRRARECKPDLPAWEYVHSKKRGRSGEPLDPQLRYYFRKGFRQIVSIQENYFPHEPSLDFGVILHGVIPLSRPKRFWQGTPLPLIESLSSMLFRFIR
ncbi:hypothetical protein [Actimicrobium antarcticum]|uniref:Uncharacterized protein n=1 Tax=Actimicrobium antarcticum TaxID=1051899 RepID=A0ABP7TGI8_9BURK